jgi:hypothetical protein
MGAGRDVCAHLKRFGQLNAGAIGYSPIYGSDGSETDGFLNMSTSIPLRSLDLSDPTPFLLYLHILARAADNLERNLSSMGRWTPSSLPSCLTRPVARAMRGRRDLGDGLAAGRPEGRRRPDLGGIG